MTTKHPHRRAVCRHGNVTYQCRCMGPKIEVIVDCTTACQDAYGEMLTASDQYVGKHRAEVAP